jgi:hypothetical protein
MCVGNLGPISPTTSSTVATGTRKLSLVTPIGSRALLLGTSVAVSSSLFGGGVAFFADPARLALVAPGFALTSKRLARQRFAHSLNAMRRITTSASRDAAPGRQWSPWRR